MALRSAQATGFASWAARSARRESLWVSSAREGGGSTRSARGRLRLRQRHRARPRAPQHLRVPEPLPGRSHQQRGSTWHTHLAVRLGRSRRNAEARRHRAERRRGRPASRLGGDDPARYGRRRRAQRHLLPGGRLPAGNRGHRAHAESGSSAGWRVATAGSAAGTPGSRPDSSRFCGPNPRLSGRLASGTDLHRPPADPTGARCSP
jgi:hypothetical protein